jgi:hypothetical protein
MGYSGAALLEVFEGWNARSARRNKEEPKEDCCCSGEEEINMACTKTTGTRLPPGEFCTITIFFWTEHNVTYLSPFTCAHSLLETSSLSRVSFGGWTAGGVCGKPRVVMERAEGFSLASFVDRKGKYAYLYLYSDEGDTLAPRHKLYI